MKVDKLTVGHVFDSTQRLDAPLFQRPYVWRKKRNWAPLWGSISAMAGNRLRGSSVKPHFLGTVVLVQQQTQMGRIQTREVIDGQQRLITLQLLLAALRDIAEQWNRTGYCDEFKKLTRNQTPLSKSAENVFKVWPTNQDRDEFRQVMQSRAPSVEEDDEDLEDETDSETDDDDGDGLIGKAYSYFRRAVGEWLGTSDPTTLEARLGAIHQAITRDLTIVVIDLESDDDPQEIFETLNGLGTPLLPADLVKNYLFHLAARRGLNGEALHDRYWRMFDDQRRYWRKSVGRGRQKRPRLDVFLSHYLALHASDQEVTAERLFEGFKDYVERNASVPVEQQMARFSEYALVYRRFEEFEPASPAGTFFYRLAAMEMTTAHPLLLEVVKRYADADQPQLNAILKDLESFIVRRAVCRLTSRSYNEFFRGMIKECQESQDFSHARIRTYLLSGSSEIALWPANDQFKESWMEVEFYRKLKRATSMILQALEDALRGPKSELQRVSTSVVTIEHLLPQKWETNWPISPNPGETPEQAQRRRKQALHRIGNLTLLTKSLNPSVSNGAWQAKRDAIRSHGTLLLHNSFLDKSHWNESAIDERSKCLFDLAVRTWPRP